MTRLSFNPLEFGLAEVINLLATVLCLAVDCGRLWVLSGQ